MEDSERRLRQRLFRTFLDLDIAYARSGNEAGREEIQKDLTKVTTSELSEADIRLILDKYTKNSEAS